MWKRVLEEIGSVLRGSGLKKERSGLGLLVTWGCFWRKSDLIWGGGRGFWRKEIWVGYEVLSYCGWGFWKAKMGVFKGVCWRELGL